MKFVAVVETEIDAGSGAPDKITKADVRQITAELRRQAVNNCVVGRYGRRGRLQKKNIAFSKVLMYINQKITPTVLKNGHATTHP